MSIGISQIQAGPRVLGQAFLDLFLKVLLVYSENQKTLESISSLLLISLKYYRCGFFSFLLLQRKYLLKMFRAGNFYVGYSYSRSIDLDIHCGHIMIWGSTNIYTFPNLHFSYSFPEQSSLQHLTVYPQYESSQRMTLILCDIIWFKENKITMFSGSHCFILSLHFVLYLIHKERRSSAFSFLSSYVGWFLIFLLNCTLFLHGLFNKFFLATIWR